MESNSGTQFGGQLLRFSSVGSLSLVLTQVAGLASALLVVRFIGFEDYGRFSLLLFLAALLSFLIGLCVKTGTMRLLFGVADEDDDEEEDDRESPSGRAPSARRSLGVAIVLTLLLGATAVAAAVVFSDPLARLLLGGPSGRGLVGLAAAIAAFGALHELAATVVWMERRPATFLRLTAARPLLTLVVVVPLVASGAGLAGAIIGGAIGTAASAVVAVIALRGRWQLGFSPALAARIVRGAVVRVPVVGSFWVVDHMSVFLLSRFASAADVGTFHLAARFAMAAAFVAMGVQLALRTLLRTTFSAAVEAEHGAATLRGNVLGYFALGVVGLLLGTTLLSQVLAPLVPPAYAVTVELVPLIAAAQIAPTALKVLNKSVKIPNRQRAFARAVVTAALLFVGVALVLIPRLGLQGPPVAALLAFAGPAAYLLLRSQRGRQPLRVSYRSVAIAAVAAVALILAHRELPDEPASLSIAAALVAFAAWLAVVLATGAVPRRQLLEALRGARPAPFDPRASLGRLAPSERAALRMAILEGRPPSELATLLGADPSDASERLVEVLRRASGGDERAPTEDDREIGNYLFQTEEGFERISAARRLLKSRDVDARELHELETLVARFGETSPDAWIDDGLGAWPTTDEPAGEGRADGAPVRPEGLT